MGNIQRRPNGKWRARDRDPAGKERAHHFARKVDAQRWLTSVEAAKARGEWIDPVRSRMTVGEWSERWLAAQVHLKPSTYARYAGVVRRQILPSWETVSLAQVTHADVAAWIAQLMAARLGARTVQKAHRVLSMILDLAVTDRRLLSNPAAGVRLPRGESPAKRFLSADQVAALANAAGKDRVLVLVLGYCGLRFGEAAALRVFDLDLPRRRLRIERSVTDIDGQMVTTTPKTHIRREVPLPRFLAQELAVHVGGHSGNDLAFSSPRGAILRLNNFRRRSFDRAAAVVGLPWLTPHMLRHTAASLAVSAGANVKAVQQMLGHASAAMTLDVYAGLFGDDLDAVADRLDELASRTIADSVRTRTAGQSPLMIMKEQA
jgi:integrase